MRRMNRIISGISAAALVFGAASCAAYASAGDTETATEVSTLEALEAAIAEGKTNIIVTGTITVNKEIDLTGVTLTAAATAGTWTDGCVIKMTDGGKITGGSINGVGRDLYVVNVISGSAELDGVTVDNQPLSNTGYPSTVTAHSTIRNNGALTLTGCTVKSGEPAAVKNEEDTTLNVDGGSITGKTIGITNWGTTTLDGGAEVKSESGSTAIYALTWDGYDGKTTVKDATIDGKIVYGGNNTTTKTPEVEIEEDAVLVNSGFELATNETMCNVPEDGDGNPIKPTLTIDPNAEVQLASTTDLDPVLIDALRDVENVTDSEGNPIEVNDDGDIVAKKFEVNTATVGGGNVTVSATSEAAGETVTITVTPDANYVLSDLTVSRKDNSTIVCETTEQPDGEYTFTMPTYDVLVRAAFAREYQISALSVNGVGFYEVSTNKATAGTEITVTVEPLTGYAVDKITYTVDGGEPVEMTGNRFTMPAGNVTIIPVVTALAPDEYSVTVNSTDTNGTVTVDKTSAAEGAEITVTATPDEGYELEAITVMNGTEKVTVTNGKFTMPAGNVTVSATFKAVPKEDEPDDNKPGDGDDKPGDGDDKPADGDNKPGDGDDKPVDGDDKPADGDDKPADGDNTDPGGSDKDDNAGGNNNNGDGSDQQPTGIALAAAPVLLAGSAVAVAAIKKKMK